MLFLLPGLGYLLAQSAVVAKLTFFSRLVLFYRKLFLLIVSYKLKEMMRGDDTVEHAFPSTTQQYFKLCAQKSHFGVCK